METWETKKCNLETVTLFHHQQVRLKVRVRVRLRLGLELGLRLGLELGLG